MLNDIIEQLFHCPACGGDIRASDPTVFECADCGSAYPFRDGIIDFGACEQTVVNDWSGGSREEAADWVRKMQEEGFLTGEDLAAVGRDIDRPVLVEKWTEAVTAIREEYRGLGPGTAVDLASGMASLLSPGIGGGFDLSGLTGTTIILTDLSGTVMRRVRDRVEPESGDAAIIYSVCDAGDLPLRDGCVDLVSSVSVLANADNGMDILRQVGRVLKEEGRFLIYDTFFSGGSRSQRLKVRMNGDLSLTAPEGIGPAFHEAGLEITGATTLYSGKARMAGDLLPLAGEEQHCMLLRGRPAER